MNKCPITYEPCGNERYSKRGLSLLSPKLTNLIDLPYSAQEQRREAAARASKMSIQGFQAKISARLSVKNKCFTLVDNKGTFIIKPQSDVYEQLPENEALTMKIASTLGIEVPLSGLIYANDGSMSYFIKRFDRYSRNKKYHQEDFAQLTNNNRDTKYKWTMEKLIPVLDHCTFPVVERLKLFRRVLFCFITGNEDMHLKNFSLISRNHQVSLSPAYDLLNSTISMPGASEELALTLAGKKSKITRENLIDYYGIERLAITPKAIEKELVNFSTKQPEMEAMVHRSFLTRQMQDKYIVLLKERYHRLQI